MGTTSPWPAPLSPLHCVSLHLQRTLLMPVPVPETQTVTTWKIACDGGQGALGHPRVWLTIPEDTGWVECGYCDKRFEIDRAHAGSDH